MKLKKLFINLISLIALIFPFYSIAALAPDELVKKTAEDVIFAIKADEEIQKGNKEKIYKLAEDKILPNFDFDYSVDTLQAQDVRVARRHRPSNEGGALGKGSISSSCAVSVDTARGR